MTNIIGGIAFLTLSVFLLFSYKTATRKTIETYQAMIALHQKYPWIPLVFGILMGLIGILMIAYGIVEYSTASAKPTAARSNRGNYSWRSARTTSAAC
jgi:hypothetical protein